MLITGVDFDGHGMARVMVDGFAAPEVDDEFVRMMGLLKGAKIDQSIYDALHERALFCGAVRTALRSLDYRDFSARELAGRLREKGILPDAAAQAVDYLRDKGYVDDARYASQVAERCVSKGYGRMRVRQELIKHGIGRDDIDTALDELPEYEDDALAACFERKYFGADLSDRKQRQRVANGLNRQGFSWDDINSFLREREREDGEEYEDW